MEIGEPISDALVRIEEQNWAGALRDICGVVEATAKAEGHPPGRRGYKAWVGANVDLIVLASSLGKLSATGLALAYTHPEMRPTPSGLQPIEEIIYHVIRCELYHGRGIPQDIEFTDNIFRGQGGGVNLGLPKTIVLGIVLAVLAAPSNAGARLTKDFVLHARGFPLHLRLFVGKKETLAQALRVAAMAAPSAQ